MSLKILPSIGFAITNYLTYIYLILFLSTIILPLLSLFFLIKNKKVSSLEINNYKERSLPLFITALWMGYGYYKIGSLLTFAPILKAELIGGITIIIVATIISKYWKISLHMLAIGGVVGVYFSLNMLIGNLQNIIIVAVIIAGIVGSARIYEKAHNHCQVYVGFIAGFLIEISAILLL